MLGILYDLVKWVFRNYISLLLISAAAITTILPMIVDAAVGLWNFVWSLLVDTFPDLFGVIDAYVDQMAGSAVLVMSGQVAYVLDTFVLMNVIVPTFVAYLAFLWFCIGLRTLLWFKSFFYPTGT